MVESGVLPLTSDGDSVMDGVAAAWRYDEGRGDDRVRGCKDIAACLSRRLRPRAQVFTCCLTV